MSAGVSAGQDPTVRLAVEDGIGTVTLDRPPVNALDSRMMEALIRRFDEINDRNDIRVVILAAAGKVFSAGADMKEHAEHPPGPGDQWRYFRTFRGICEVVRECRKPVIGALGGPVLGGGLGLAAACDILIASTRCEVGLPEVAVGTLGGARNAMDLFGRSHVRAMVLTGRRIGAAELARLGVVLSVVEPDELMPAARQLAEEIADKSPAAVEMAKAAANAVESMDLFQGFRFEQAQARELARHPDSEEARRAFLERRPAVFRRRGE